MQWLSSQFFFPFGSERDLLSGSVSLLLISNWQSKTLIKLFILEIYLWGWHILYTKQVKHMTHPIVPGAAKKV